jgi:diacylglycerol kinase family enzyme
MAGRRRTAALWRVLDLLAESGVHVEVAHTQHAGHAVELAREAACRGERMVVAAGGDGTIAEVANGLMGGTTALGIIPLGTANVLAREYGLSTHPRAVANTLAYRRSRPLWPGVVRLAGREQVFVQMAGLGFDGAVVHNLNRLLKMVIGRGAYVWQTAWESVAYKYPPVRLVIDGVAHEAASVVVSKGRFYGGRYMLAPEARPHEPGFQVVLVQNPGTLAALRAAGTLPLGLLPCCGGVRILAAQEVVFPNAAGLPLQTDGDAQPGTPLALVNASVPISLITG